MKTTVSIQKQDFKKNGPYTRKWFFVDASGKTLGRLSTQIATILSGKHKPIYTPHTDTGDFVIVINANKVKLSGSKWSNKVYYHHTGYPGGIKQVKAEDLLKNHPERLIQKAVKGMMPKNQLNRYSIQKLKVYSGAEHPHQAQKPQPLEIK